MERIEIDDIKAGDIIRFVPHEPIPAYCRLRSADYLARSNGDGFTGEPPGDHFLLERPKPPVELPTTPTLGVVTLYNGDKHAGRVVGGDVLLLVDGKVIGAKSAAAAFEPAIVVPASAITALRAAHGDAACTPGIHEAYSVRTRAMENLIAAVEGVPS